MWWQNRIGRDAKFNEKKKLTVAAETIITLNNLPFEFIRIYIKTKIEHSVA